MICFWTFLADIADHESDSNDSDYIPFKPSPPKVKRGRGRPRKYALKPAKGSRPRGRPPARPKVELKEEEEAVEDGEGEFHCLDCKKIFHRSSALKKHRCDNEVQKVCDGVLITIFAVSCCFRYRFTRVTCVAKCLQEETILRDTWYHTVLINHIAVKSVQNHSQEKTI